VAGKPPTTAEGGNAIAAIAEAAGTGATVLALSEPDSARPGPRRVIVAVQDLPDDAQALADAAAAAAYMDAHLVVAHGVPTSFGERSIGLDTAVEQAGSLLDAAVQQASAAVSGLTVEPWLARVQPHELVGEGLDADLLVVGGPRAGPAAELGLVARSALHHAPCAVLLTPRPARRDGLPNHDGYP
jgi:nucleotide-binding universal stress UspA family protein